MSFNKVEILLPFSAYSVNKMTYRDVRFKTAEYKDWATKVLAALSDEKGLVDLAAIFNEKGGCFDVSVIVEYPHHVFYNKAGEISSKTIDCTNVGKPLIDLIFRDTMGVNDKYITWYSEAKQVGPTHCIKVLVRLQP